MKSEIEDRGARWTKFDRPRSCREYGYQDGKPIFQAPGIPLLPWAAIDDEAEAKVASRPSQYVVVGEDVGDERDLLMGRKIVTFPARRYPRLAISPAYMKWLAYEHKDYRWHRADGE